MIIYIFKKIVAFLFIICVLAQISFCLVYFSPHSLFNDLSFVEAYRNFFKQLFQGQFTLLSGETVPFFNTLAATFELCILALMVTLIVGLPLGIFLGLSRINWLNNVIRLICLLLYSCPIVLLVVMVMFLLSPTWSVSINFNVSSLVSVSGSSLLKILLSSRVDKIAVLLAQLHYLLLPIFILSIQPSIMTIQLVSQNVQNTSQQNFIKMATIRERSPFRILRRHLLPNTIPATIPQLTYNTTTLLFSTMVVEILFNRVGLGQWIMSAYYHHNYFIISIAILACGTVISLLTLLGEITAVMIYPLRHKENHV
ncbi:hypothetical protein A9G48_09540 [Gilliamella sp. wkB18]|uniref:ABC transporter permease subunit n=1 Tax=Gilliamella sp. wkB18 TaxID=3120260 RepID=UPI0004DD1A1A|nr:ABC transporter permease subunit [Gilliamella apicola]KFA58127.1 Peptide transport system permease protein SapB [Gilliamella apicola]OCG61969.1 hypothetical protein A9G48_09540 [Gilliamella apicola]